MEGEVVSGRGSSAPRLALRFALGVLFAGILLRLVFLDADPVYDLWAGYLTDEGRWTEQARQVVLFGSTALDTWHSKVHLALAPLFQAVTALSFAVFGVGFASARFVSALTGIALLISAYLILRRGFSSEALLLTMTVLALQPDLLFLSRVAIPEIPSMLFQFLAFSILVSTPRSAKRTAIAGLLTAGALAFKATVLPVVVIFAVILWCVHDREDSGSRWGMLVGFFGGVLAPVLVILCSLLIAGGTIPLEPEDLKGFSGFFRLASTYAAATFFFNRHYVQGMNLVLLGLWTIAGMLMVFGWPSRSRVRDIYVGSGIWVFASLGLSVAVKYYPLYYTLPLLVPAALNLGAGVTLLRLRVSRGGTARLASLEGGAEKFATAWLLLPLALILSPVIAAAAGVFGFPMERFSERFLVIVVLYLFVLTAAFRWKPRRLVVGSVIFPLVLLPLWSLGIQADLVDGSFWAANGASTLAIWIWLFAIAAGMAAFLSARCTAGAPAWKWPLGYVLALSPAWLLQTGPTLLFPSYTIAETSVALGTELDEFSVIGSGSAASFFLENRLHYVEGAEGDALPEVFVVAFDDLPRPLVERYRIVREYELELGNVAKLDESQTTLQLFRRVD